MLPAHFKARLKTWDDRLLEEGYASVSIENRSVDFQNEFVPLLELGTTVKVFQLQEDKEIHCFIGRVYLSSRRLLRVVSVSDDLLTEAEKQLPVEVDIKGQLRLQSGGIKSIKSYPAHIYPLSPAIVKFTCPLQLPAGSCVLLSFSKPFAIEGLAAQVYQSILFGDSHSGYLCHVQSAPDPGRTRLSDFIEAHTRSLPRLLPRI